jgi:hypothetical protein
MANIRTKIYILLLVALAMWITVPGMSQVIDAPEDSPVIKENVESCQEEILYWNNELDISKVYCNESTQDICDKMGETCKYELEKWTAELKYQNYIGSKYVVHSGSYWQAKKYLSWAYKALEGVRQLYKRTGIKQLAYVISAMEEAISIAEKIIKYFNK